MNQSFTISGNRLQYFQKKRKKSEGGKTEKKIALIVFGLVFFSFFSYVFAGSSGYWLRGSDFENFVENSKANFLTANSPNASSNKTVLIPDEKGVIGKWYTVSIPLATHIYSKVVFWANNVEGTGKFYWELYDFNPENFESIIIARGVFEKAGEESFALLEKPYIVQTGHRLKVVLKFEGVNGKIILDETKNLSKSEFASGIGETFVAENIVSTAIIAFSKCSGSEIACNNDFGCDDLNPFTEDFCSNAATCQAKCEHKECFPLCTNSAQCFDGNPFTFDKCENAGSCNASCINPQCIVKCSQDSECSDSNNETIDSCVYAGTCFSFCSNEPSNGKTIKQTGCRIIECNKGNCIESNALNCCGNDLCEQNEKCEKDCLPDLARIEITSPLKGDYLVKGEKLEISAKAEKGSKLFVSGFFGKAELFDNGTTNDGKAGDGIFANSFEISKEATPGLKTIAVESVEPKKGSVFLHVNLIPLLEFDIKSDKKEYVASDFLQISGSVSRKGNPVQGLVKVEAFSNNSIVFSESSETDKFGKFKISYKSLPSGPLGEWAVKGRIVDDFGNVGEKETKVLFFDPEQMLPLKIVVLKDLKKAYKTGEILEIELSILHNNEKVRDAKVSSVFGEKEFEFLNTENGTYLLKTELPENMKKGELKIPVLAQKDKLAGKTVLVSEVEASEIIVKILSPEKKSFEIGENVEMKIGLFYGNSQNVGDAVLQAEKNGEKLAVEKSNGVYSIRFKINNLDANGFVVKLKAIDFKENLGTAEFSGTVSGYSFWHYIDFYGPILLLPIIALIFGAFILIYSQFRKTRIERLKENESELLKKVKYVQTRYFKLGGFTREKYDELMLKYSRELENVRKQVEKSEK